MIQKLKSYPAYKDSGVEWLGKVPQHWEVKPAFAMYKEKSYPNIGLLETTVLSLSYGKINIKPESKLHGLVPESFETYQVVDPGDIVIRTTDLQNDRRSVRVAQSTYRGIITSAYLLLSVRQHAHPGYGYLLLYLWDITKAIYGFGSGLRQSLSFSDFKRMPTIVPPLPEQRAIVKFLDWADRRIRLIIAARKKRIRLLEEYRQTLINDAVTGKFDVRTGKPYPAYKDSGVEWLGKVPEGWEVKQLKRVTRLNPSKTEVPRALRTGHATFLPMERVGNDGTFDASEIRPVKDLWNGFTYFRKGDVIVAKITPSFENGKGALLETLPTTLGFGSTEFHVLRPSKLILPKYLYLLTVHSEFRRLGADHMTGAAGQQRVPADFIANFPVPLPTLPEQRAIAEYLDRETKKVDAAIENTKKSIELWEELRATLIADVVTGKLDVREVAEGLPEEEPELTSKIEAFEASLQANEAGVDEGAAEGEEATLEETA